jgi:hypothetical protein
MKNKKSKRTLAILLAMVLALLPAATGAANTLPDVGPGPNEKLTITMDGQSITFVDIGTNAAANMDNRIEFYFDVLDPANNDILKYWSALAYSLFREYRDSCRVRGVDGDFDKAFGSNNGGRAHYVDLVDALARGPGNGISTTGTPSGNNDKQFSTGLVHTTNLHQVEENTFEYLAQVLPNKATWGDFSNAGNIPFLHGDKTHRDVIYTIAVSTDQHHDSNQWDFNAFGIAFYDFNLAMILPKEPFNTVLDDKGLTVDEAIEAQAQLIDLFSYEEKNATTSSAGVLINEEILDGTGGKTVSISDSWTWSNSIERTEGHTFTNTWEAGGHLDFNFGISSNNPRAQAGVHFTYSGSSATAVETAKSEGSEESRSKEETLAVETPLPAHTIKELTSRQMFSEMSMKYDQPIAISFRAVIFSRHGEVKGDRNFLDGQGTFSAVFGKNVAEPAPLPPTVDDAMSSLERRVIRSHTQPTDIDRTYGNTLGKTMNDDGDKAKNFAEYIDWAGVKSGVTINGQPRVNVLSHAKGNIGTPEQIIKWINSNRPMVNEGALIKEQARKTYIVIGEAVPLHPLHLVRPTKEQIEYENVIVGDKINNIHMISLDGVDMYDVPYHGFAHKIPEMGSWRLLDIDFEPLPEDNPIAKLVENAAGITFHALGAGEGYISYRIAENVYTYYQAPGYTKADDVEPALIYFKISNPVPEQFTGTVEAEGEITLTIGNDPIKISEIPTVSVSVYDETGREIEAEVVWEARELASSGIIVNNNEIRVTAPNKTGKPFNVRAVYKGVYSHIEAPWIPVTAVIPTEEGLELAELTRGDLALILYFVASVQGISGLTGFTDIDENELAQIYKEAVAWASQNGIINGYNTSTFGVKDHVTKEQFITIMYRYANYLGIDTAVEAAEHIELHGVSPWARQAVEWALSRGWITMEDIEYLMNPITIEEVEEILVPIAEEAEIPLDNLPVPEELPVPEPAPAEEEAVEPEAVEPEAPSDGTETPSDGGTAPSDGSGGGSEAPVGPSDGGSTPSDGGGGSAPPNGDPSQ